MAAGSFQKIRRTGGIFSALANFAKPIASGISSLASWGANKLRGN